ncbi:MAG: hypothetical protein JNM27_05065 [Leptospirales bacterium]|nr:hypothetical protein [Leptospirales bacterium]
MKAAFTLLLLALYACSPSDISDFYIRRTHASLPGRGLSEENGQIVWTLNAGIYQDADLPALTRKEAEPLLAEAAKIVRKSVPEIEIRFILDQPQDAEYMLSTLIREKKQVGAEKNQEALLNLDPGPAAMDENRALLAKSTAASQAPRILSQIQHLQGLKNNAGLPLLSGKNLCKSSRWNAFFRNQVRYDLILTNGVFYPDSLASESEQLLRPDGALLWKIYASPGRSAMDQSAAVFSLQGAPPEARIRELADLLLMLVLPVDSSGLTRFKGDPGFAAAHLSRRMVYLRSLVRFHSTGRCEGLSLDFAIDRERKAAASSGLAHLRRICPEKKD